MSQDAREYAVNNGAPIMIYPAKQPESGMEDIINAMRIDVLKHIFGAWRWPRMG